MKVNIREERKTDKATLDEFYADEEVLKEIWLPSNADSWISLFRKHLKQNYGFTILADGKIVGEIRLDGPSICRSTYNAGFAVGRKFWGQGICTEALKQIVRFAFDELKLHKVVGDSDSDNPASGRVFEKAGFKKEGVFKEHVFKQGRYIDRIHWGLINPVITVQHSSKT
jgi:RimJ/RimL family protein N-acetyltransferase